MTAGGRPARGPGRVRAVPLAVLGLLSVLACVWLLSLVPGRVSAERAYLGASPCPPGTRTGACLALVPATVEARDERRRGRAVVYALVVVEDGAETARRVEMDGTSPVYGSVRPGDAVTVEYWRGAARAVRSGDAAQRTEASPVGAWRLPLGLALPGLPLGCGTVWVAWWHRHRYRAAMPARPWQTGMVVAGCAAESAAGFLGALAADSAAAALVVTVAAVPAVAVVTVLAVRWRLRRAADALRITPVTPVERTVLRADVHGDVPYGVGTHGFLRLGEGAPAAMADPGGRIACEPLPPTLTVLGVRPFLRDDPPGEARAYGRDGIVVECRDGGTLVRVVVRRRDAPLVVGVLGAGGVSR
ncbi:hypothetical protein [Streptomyces sp. NPDC049879]|uniref:hypothetical protein n=1 Tax=Streptomyces sp. NPDC049879 TaxID=3365598 RepID=UPI0037B768DB